MDFEKIKDVVTSIEMSPDMERRVKENMGKRKKTTFRKWIPAASTFAALLVIMAGLSTFTFSGEIQGVNFAITAYAVGEDTTITPDQATIELGTEDRMGIVSIGGDGDKYMFTDVMLKITGEQIDSITYTMSDGKFVEDVTITSDKHPSTEWLQKENINFVLSEPDSGIYEGVREIGKTYTVPYTEQEKNKYTLAIPHDGNNGMVNDVMINVSVKYTDGSSEQQDIIVTQESDSILLKLK